MSSETFLFFGLHQIGSFIYGNLLGDELAQNLNCEVLFFHFGDLRKEVRIEQRQRFLNVRKEVDNSAALHARFKQLVDALISFSEYGLPPVPPPGKANQQRPHRLEEGRFEPLDCGS